MSPSEIPDLASALASFASLHVRVAGDVMLDHYLWGDASRLSPEAPVPVVCVRRETRAPGGAANVALNLRALGARVSLFGRLGTDDAGRRLADALAGAGVELLPGSVAEGVPTLVKTRILCRGQQLCRLDREAPPDRFAVPADELAARCGAPDAEGAPPDALLLSDYAKGVLTSEGVRALQGVEPRSGLVALDPKPRAGFEASGLGLLTPNRGEALRMAGLDETGGEFPAEAIEEILKLAL